MKPMEFSQSFLLARQSKEEQREEGWAERGKERMDVGKRQDSHLILIGEMGKYH